MADYTLKHTDPANGVFVVHDNSADGPQVPSAAAFYVNPLTGVSAVSANTSLVFIGKSLAEYGEVIQNNILYLTENFANKTRPVNPTQGQIWYKNADYADPAFPSDPVDTGLYIWYGSNWGAIMISTGSSLDLDMNGYKIINLAPPTLPSDAVNLAYADSHYLKLTGGTVNGPVNFNGGPYSFGAGVFASIVTAPTSPTHIANKQYVDLQDAALNSSLTAQINAVQSQLSNYVLKTGDTMTGTLTLSANANLAVLGGGTGTVSFGSRRVQDVANPSLNLDAANKIYVDQAISTAIANIPPPSGGGTDGVVYAGNLNSSGTLTLLRTQGLPDVVVSGSFALQTHTHDTNAVNVSTSATYPQSVLIPAALNGDLTEPTDTLTNVLRVLDQAIADVRRPNHRELIVQTTPGNTTFTVQKPFPVDEAKLQVYKNGVKQYATERGQSEIVFTGTPGLNDGPLVPNGAYSFSLNVNGTGYTINITAAALTYYELASQIAERINALSIPASVQILQSLDSLSIVIKSNTVGSGSSCNITPGSFLTTISTYSTTYNRSVTTSYGYYEVGDPGDNSVQFVMTPAPAVGEVIEVIITV